MDRDEVSIARHYVAFDLDAEGDRCGRCCLSWFCAFSFIGILLIALGVMDMVIEHYHYDLNVIEPKYLMAALTLVLGSIMSIISVGVCIHRKQLGKNACCYCCKKKGKRGKIVLNSNLKQPLKSHENDDEIKSKFTIGENGYREINGNDDDELGTLQTLQKEAKEAKETKK